MSKKIGSKLADSVKQSRVNGAGDTARSEATSAPPSPTAASMPAAAKQPAKTEPRPSHGVLHPSRVWPD